MNIMIVKLGATGDVVRSTPIFRRLNGSVSWITEAKNCVLLEGVRKDLRCFSWEQRDQARDRTYDLLINLEDTVAVAEYVRTVQARQLFGAHLADDNQLRYTDDSRQWFDLSLISVHGKEQADRLKAKNRRTYQELVFAGLGFHFTGEEYLLPEPDATDLKGDVAIAAEAGPVWPMKKWAYYDKLKSALEERGLVVNFLRTRPSLLEHMADVSNHRCLVSGDSLPMHLALGTRTRCVSIFTCTSPWEIYGYGIQTKIISPLLEEFFYQRGFQERATTAITLDEVLKAILEQLHLSKS